MEAVNIFSLNAKGLNIPEKRKMLLHDLKHHRADLALIQETHFKSSNHPILKNKLFPLAYHSTNGSSKTRGVSILISHKVPWKYTDIRCDPEGIYLFLKGEIGGVQVTLANIYVPNCHQDHFIHKIMETLLEFTSGHSGWRF